MVAPNPIDFDYVFKEFSNIFESGNVVVLSTVLCIFGLWIVGLIIIRRADRKDEYKVSIAIMFALDFVKWRRVCIWKDSHD